MTMNSSDYKRISKAALTDKWGIAMGTFLVAALLGGTSSRISFNFSFDNVSFEDLSALFENGIPSPAISTLLISAFSIFFTIALPLSIALFFVGSIVGVGHSQFNIDVIDGKEAQFGKLFSWFKNKLWSTAVLSNLLVTLYTFLWTLLFIIPGIMAAYSYRMTPYILAENPNMPPKEALNRSKELMYGHRWELFCLKFSFIGWNILSVLTLGILGLWINPWMCASEAAFYRNLVPLPSDPPEETSEEFSTTFI